MYILELSAVTVRIGNPYRLIRRERYIHVISLLLISYTILNYVSGQPLGRDYYSWKSTLIECSVDENVQ